MKRETRNAHPGVHPLRERDVEILRDLEWRPTEWLTPMMVGGRDASYHLASLMKLVARGLVERRERAGWIRRSWLYRITPEGVIYVASVRRPRHNARR